MISSSITCVLAGRTRRLQDEAIHAANVLGDLDHHFAVAERADLGLAELDVEITRDLLARTGFELPAKSFMRCMICLDAESHSARIWLGRQDSNLQMAAPKAAALPFGDAPATGTVPEPTKALVCLPRRPRRRPDRSILRSTKPVRNRRVTDYPDFAPSATLAQIGATVCIRSTASCASSAFPNTPKTVGPLPDIPTIDAPASHNRSCKRATGGQSRTAAGRRSFDNREARASGRFRRRRSRRFPEASAA